MAMAKLAERQDAELDKEEDSEESTIP